MVHTINGLAQHELEVAVLDRDGRATEIIDSARAG
jgi:hypothetical protein